MKYKTGRKKPVYTPLQLKRGKLMKSALLSLGLPPPSSHDWVTAVEKQVGGANGWGMYLNDQVGDCVFADTAHAMMLRTANTGTMLKPTDADAQNLYEVFGYNPNDVRPDGSNPTDQGANEQDVCEYLVKTGWLGHKALATAPIVTDVVGEEQLNRIRWTIQLFGHCRLGINVPAAMERQFDANQPFHIQGNMESDEGHDIVAVGYTPTTFRVVTWARNCNADPEWIKAVTKEAHLEFWSDWISAKSHLSPSNFDQAALAQRVLAVQA